MLKNVILKRTNLPLYQKAMDAYSLRLKTISNNIANVGTREYQRKEVEFEQLLDDALNKPTLQGSRTSENHMKLGTDRIDELEAEVVTPEDNFSNGINNVNIDHEMIELSKVQMNDSFLAKSVSGFFRTMRSAIRGQSQG
jgi:flagellar basal-body rod protein FlgB